MVEGDITRGPLRLRFWIGRAPDRDGLLCQARLYRLGEPSYMGFVSFGSVADLRHMVRAVALDPRPFHKCSDLDPEWLTHRCDH